MKTKRKELLSKLHSNIRTQLNRQLQRLFPHSALPDSPNIPSTWGARYQKGTCSFVEKCQVFGIERILT